MSANPAQIFEFIFLFPSSSRFFYLFNRKRSCKMTRVTSIGIKRTYLEAGFADDSPQHQTLVKDLDVLPSDLQTDDANNEPAQPKKKRKRTKKSQRTGGSGATLKASGEETEVVDAVSGDPDKEVPNNKKQKQSSKEGRKKKKIIKVR